MAGFAKVPANGKSSGENLSLLALLEQDFIDMSAAISDKLTGNRIHILFFVFLADSCHD
jgi:hypothetical protein